MPALPIPPDLVANVTEPARRSLHDILRRFNEVAPGAERDRTVIHELRIALLSAVDTALREEVHILNSHIGNIPNLPKEVWSEIWSRLPMYDRVSVTHVCHDWRSVALASSTLWSDIELEYCCNVSSDAYQNYYGDYPQTCRMDGSPHAEHGGPTNNWTHFSSLVAILNRGRAPLRLSLKISGEHLECMDDFLSRLAETLSPHAPRLVDLTFMGNFDLHVDLPLFLVPCGPSFPRLVNLQVSDCLQNMFPSEETIAVYGRLDELQVPALRTVDFNTDSSWFDPLLLRNDQALVLRNVAFCPPTIKPVIDLLRVSPQLRSLHLNFRACTFSHHGLHESFSHAGIHALEDLKITDLDLDTSNQSAATQLVELLLRPSHQSIQLSFHVSREVETTHSALSRSAKMFTDLFRRQDSVADTMLMVTMSDTSATVDLFRTATGESRSSATHQPQRRLLAFDKSHNLEEALLPVWDALDTTRICSFQLDLSAGARYSPPFPLIKTSSNVAEAWMVLSRLELFTILRSERASLDQLQAIDWSTAVPAGCTFEVKDVDKTGDISSVLSYKRTGLFSQWLLES